MKILLLSDLHLEFYEDAGKSFIDSLPLSDAVVLAGDITTIQYFVDVFPHFTEKYAHVIHVAGNHEFYHSDVDSVLNYLAALSKDIPNYHFLENQSVEIEGQRFLGCTLWFPKPIEDSGGINDHRLIDNFEPWVYEQNNRSVKFLQTEMTSDDFVITHHLPSWKSVAPQYQGSPLNKYFVCNVENIIVEKQPKYWIHGHSHSSFNYKIGSTNIIANPFGYKNYEENEEFIYNLIIEV